MRHTPLRRCNFQNTPLCPGERKSCFCTVSTYRRNHTESCVHRGKRCNTRMMLQRSRAVPSPAHIVAYHMGFTSLPSFRRRSMLLAYWKCRWLRSPPSARADRGGMGAMASRYRKGQPSGASFASNKKFSLASRPLGTMADSA